MDTLSISFEIAQDECRKNPLLISQHCFREWLGAVKHQAITWTNVDLDLQYHMHHQGAMS